MDTDPGTMLVETGSDYKTGMTGIRTSCTVFRRMFLRLTKNRHDGETGGGQILNIERAINLQKMRQSAPSFTTMTDSEKDQEKVREPTKSPADAQQSATEGDQHSKPSLQTVLDDGQEKEQYPHGITLGLITLALCLAVFLMALDNT
ncbi:hypothetical protein E1B28_004723 [Marasmius oreades]|uniref:Uncharacterized protein n=1 Tax=Marasmius oreades TaxID=181124 RepID=A0A9P7UZ89_9AGAR|nr:uncharacterized protein E1B28_004723 [Marasmius oreades]KAG7097373.1 hypothetical protein E1B28_004723 [Marasmius oreades]